MRGVSQQAKHLLNPHGQDRRPARLRTCSCNRGCRWELRSAPGASRSIVCSCCQVNRLFDALAAKARAAVRPASGGRRPVAAADPRSCSSSRGGSLRSGIHWREALHAGAKAGHVAIVGGKRLSSRGCGGSASGTRQASSSPGSAACDPPSTQRVERHALRGRDFPLASSNSTTVSLVTSARQAATPARRRTPAARAPRRRRHRHRSQHIALRRRARLRRPAARRARRPSRRGGCPARGGAPADRDRPPGSPAGMASSFVGRALAMRPVTHSRKPQQLVARLAESAWPLRD